jgi:hypothetical protein
MLRTLFVLIFCIRIFYAIGNDRGYLLYNSSCGIPDCRFENDTSFKFCINGQVLNIFNEPVDSIVVIGELPDFKDSVYSDVNGFYKICVPNEKSRRAQKMMLRFVKEDYKPFDTTFYYSYRDKDVYFEVKLIPKYKILVKGRVLAGNMPVENVEVIISHNKKDYRVKTLDCYYDDENYWNCLYQGMFKHEIVTDDPNDSIYLYFSKPGFRSMQYKFRFADYTGELVKYKMIYADSIPELPDNSFNLKLAYPLSSESGWFLGLSYYRLIKTGNFKRLAPGIEISMVTLNQNIDYVTFSGLETSYDTTYITGMAGPSLLLYLTKPYIRRFCAYLGSTFALSFRGAESVYQPFAGVRFFLDMNKSVSIDIRYLKYSYDAKRYRFNYLGNADSYFFNKSDERLLINLGLQICF